MNAPLVRYASSAISTQAATGSYAGSKGSKESLGALSMPVSSPGGERSGNVLSSLGDMPSLPDLPESSQGESDEGAMVNNKNGVRS
jgi:hypothetical protein